MEKRLLPGLGLKVSVHLSLSLLLSGAESISHQAMSQKPSESDCLLP